MGYGLYNRSAHWSESSGLNLQNRYAHWSENVNQQNEQKPTKPKAPKETLSDPHLPGLEPDAPKGILPRLVDRVKQSVQAIKETPEAFREGMAEPTKPRP